MQKNLESLSPFEWRWLVYSIDLFDLPARDDLSYFRTEGVIEKTLDRFYEYRNSVWDLKPKDTPTSFRDFLFFSNNFVLHFVGMGKGMYCDQDHYKKWFREPESENLALQISNALESGLINSEKDDELIRNDCLYKSAPVEYQWLYAAYCGMRQYSTRDGDLYK